MLRTSLNIHCGLLVQHQGGTRQGRFHRRRRSALTTAVNLCVPKAVLPRMSPGDERPNP